MNIEYSPPQPSSPPVIITIDGPAGTGKSTVAHGLARRLGLEFLDTGAMYRAAALIAVERDIPSSNGPELAEAVRSANIHFDWNTDPPRMIVEDRDVSGRIRELDVSEIVSFVAAQSEVRAVLVERQRDIATHHPRLVTEGRDQGSVVFPDAPVRFFLNAEESVRAGRRLAQLEAAGKTVDESRIRRDIRDRDRIDSTRTDGPLIRPHGAIDVDTSLLSVMEVVAELERHVRRVLGAGISGS